MAGELLLFSCSGILCLSIHYGQNFPSLVSHYLESGVYVGRLLSHHGVNDCQGEGLPLPLVTTGTLLRSTGHWNIFIL
ncbi:hypothetical protein BGZ63DRAFT_381413 [Mariannaea sp. PMI_226]|nr:hypothetical protein BGZ63DRAFT_381413 [Mariannaea sp. PMI_226]